MKMLKKISEDIKNILIPRVKSQLPSHIQALFGLDIKYHINPTGKFVIGGPHGDTGLTGRKIIGTLTEARAPMAVVLSPGKTRARWDRSAAYAVRHVAENMVAAGVADQMLVQVSYAIGVAEPMGVFVETYGTAKVDMNDGQIAEKVTDLFNLKPYHIERSLKLRNPIYTESAAYGHMGRTYRTERIFDSMDGTVKRWKWSSSPGKN